jgi:sugar-specific transcriptional regulator TrmB
MPIITMASGSFYFGTINLSMDIAQNLEKFGLSEKEAKVYVALLELGQSAASEIARQSGIKRATTYVTLDSLIEKGLASSFKQENTKQFVANEPDSLKKIIKARKKEWKEKEKDFDQILPNLKSIQNKDASKPVTRFFEGRKGLAQSAEEFYSQFESGEEPVRLFYSRDKIEEATSEELRSKFRKMRMDKNIESDVIYSYSKGDYTSKKTQNRLKVDSSEFPIPIDLEIYGDQIFISTLEDKLSAILIKNKDIADSFKTLFRLAKIGARTEQEEKS